MFGSTIANDVSERDVQLARGQLTPGKGVATFCPLGPTVVTADELADPAAIGIEGIGELRNPVTAPAP